MYLLKDNKDILKCLMLVKSTILYSKLFHTETILSLKIFFYEHSVLSTLKTVCNYDQFSM